MHAAYRRMWCILTIKLLLCSNMSESAIDTFDKKVQYQKYVSILKGVAK